MLLYIHIPKTGGVTIGHILTKDKKDNNIIDEPIRNISTKKLKNKHIITSIRNPFDRLVSLYYYNINNKNNIILNQYKNFKEFCLDLPNLPIDTKKRGLQKKSLNLAWSSLTHYLTLNNQIYPVDFFIRFEYFERDLRVAYYNYLGPKEIKIPFMNESIHPPYEDCYTKKTKLIIYDYYKDDFKNFYPNFEI